MLIFEIQNVVPIFEHVTLLNWFFLVNQYNCSKRISIDLFIEPQFTVNNYESENVVF